MFNGRYVSNRIELTWNYVSGSTSEIYAKLCGEVKDTGHCISTNSL